MALRASLGLRNFLQSGGSLKQALQNSRIQVFSGAQPAAADDAASGTLLLNFTAGGDAHTPETPASGTVTLNTGAAGSVDTVSVNGIDILGDAVDYAGSLALTATAVALQINRNPKNALFSASASGSIVTIRARPGLGALPNGWVVLATLTTLTASHTNMAAGVDAANGLGFDVAANGVVAKRADETWQGTGLANGTAGWFRMLCSAGDAGAADTNGDYIRLDGAIAASGGQLNMSATQIAAGAVQTLSAFALTEPAQ
jgi:hypothetical protein